MLVPLLFQYNQQQIMVQMMQYNQQQQRMMQMTHSHVHNL